LKRRRRRGVGKLKAGLRKLSSYIILSETVTTSVSDLDLEEERRNYRTSTKKIKNIFILFLCIKFLLHLL
jgi:hypothetical protein